MSCTQSKLKVTSVSAGSTIWLAFESGSNSKLEPEHLTGKTINIMTIRAANKQMDYSLSVYQMVKLIV